MTRKLLLITVVTIMSCANDKQEPIFHLFKVSHEYPNYDEVDVLTDAGFAMGLIENRKVLTKFADGIELSFVLTDENELESKITQAYLITFDTLAADIVIKNYDGKRAGIWRIKDDSTRTTSVNLDHSKTELTFRRRGGKSFLESKFNLFHRIIKN
jgi:hypothetical protein